MNNSTNTHFISQTSHKRGFTLTPLLVIAIVALILVSSSIYYFSTHNTGTAASSHTKVSTRLATPTATMFVNEQPLFSDNFFDNSKNWDTRSATGYGISIGNGALTMKEANHRIFQEPVPAIVPTGFTVTTTFTLTQGDQNDSAGLQLRANPDNSQGYIIEVYGDNTFDIVKISPDPNDSTSIKLKTLSDQEHPPALHPAGQPNTLTVIMKGSTMVVVMNNTVVKTVTDTSFSGGSIDLFLANGETSRAAIATFDNIAIYPAPTNLPH